MELKVSDFLGTLGSNYRRFVADMKNSPIEKEVKVELILKVEDAIVKAITETNLHH